LTIEWNVSLKSNIEQSRRRIMKSKFKATLTWFGHSAFKLESPSGKIILIDPWLENPKAPAGAKEIEKVDIILVSHGHSDHVGNTIEIAKRTNAKVFSIYELCLWLQSQGVATAMGFNKGGTVDIEGIKVTMTDAKHSADIDVDGKVVACGGEAAGFVIRLENGLSVYHAGDTSLFGDMQYVAKLHQPDVAILPIGDLYTMGPRDAALACELLKPKHIIGMHYGTFPPLTGTPQQLRKHLHTKLKKRMLELEPGKEVTL
jgi:L-ascorbate metabolism protein UlaG (beta-lactamase superfamily)